MKQGSWYIAVASSRTSRRRGASFSSTPYPKGAPARSSNASCVSAFSNTRRVCPPQSALPLHHDRAFGHESGNCADRCEGWRERGSDQADAQGQLDERLSLFVLDRNAADIALMDQLLDLAQQVLARDRDSVKNLRRRAVALCLVGHCDVSSMTLAPAILSRFRATGYRLCVRARLCVGERHAYHEPWGHGPRSSNRKDRVHVQDEILRSAFRACGFNGRRSCAHSARERSI